MPFAIKIKLEGLKDALDSLQSVGRTVRNKILRKALNDATQPILASAKARAAIGPTRQLRRSLGRRVKTYRLSGAVVAVIGPRRGYRVLVERAGRQVPHDPAKIAHLVEYGHVVVRGGKVVGHTPPHPFMAPAMEENRTQAVSLISSRIANELDRLAAKGGA